jgi:hypothetical protein
LKTKIIQSVYTSLAFVQLLELLLTTCGYDFFRRFYIPEANAGEYGFRFIPAAARIREVLSDLVLARHSCPFHFI